jgi:hypothetical protein
MSTVPAAVPRVRYREGARGFELQIGKIVFSQSTYLLVAAVVVGVGGGFGAIAFRKLIELEGSLAFGAMLPRFASVVPHAIALVAVLAIVDHRAIRTRSARTRGSRSHGGRRASRRRDAPPHHRYQSARLGDLDRIWWQLRT